MKPVQLMHLLAPATALIIDSSLTNGLYTTPNLYEQVTITPRGHCADRKCSYLSTDVPHGLVLKDRVPLPDSKPFCYEKSNDTVPTSEYHEALNMLFQTPLFWIPPETARFALYNNTVVYICNLRKWNSGSLVEYMEAMRIFDKKCGDKFPWTAAPPGQEHVAKLAVPDLDTFFGRELRGRAICREETEDYWLKNELPNMENRGCQSFVNGVVNIFKAKSERCNWDGGETYREFIKGFFPWWHNQ